MPEKVVLYPGKKWEDWHGNRFGYQWFLRTDYIDSTPIDSFVRTGWGGQRIIVYPGLDAVVVLTGGNYVTFDYINDVRVIEEYILPALFYQVD